MIFINFLLTISRNAAMKLSYGELKKASTIHTFFLVNFHIQWNLVIKRSDITKPSYNKVILMVPTLYISVFFYPDIVRNQVIFMVPRTSL